MLEQGAGSNLTQLPGISDSEEARAVLELDGCKSFCICSKVRLAVAHGRTTAETVFNRWIHSRTVENRRGVHASGQYVFGPT